MLKFWTKLIRSSKFMNRLADEIGVDPKLYKTALTEVGTNFANYESWFNSPIGQQRETLGTMAQSSCEPAMAGAIKLKRKFPTEQRIDAFIRKIEQYAANAAASSRDASPETRAEEDAPRSHVVERLAFQLRQQLLLSGITDLSALLDRDAFVAGYLVGFCGAGSHMMIGEVLSPTRTHAYLLFVLAEFLGNASVVEEAMSRIVGHQEQRKFSEGRLAADRDIGSWFESEGQRVPMKLCTHLGVR